MLAHFDKKYPSTTRKINILPPMRAPPEFWNNEVILQLGAKLTVV
jgi:hypothetical protein